MEYSAIPFARPLHAFMCIGIGPQGRQDTSQNITTMPLSGSEAAYTEPKTGSGPYISSHHPPPPLYHTGSLYSTLSLCSHCYTLLHIARKRNGPLFATTNLLHPIFYVQYIYIKLQYPEIAI